MTTSATMYTMVCKHRMCTTRERVDIAEESAGCGHCHGQSNTTCSPHAHTIVPHLQRMKQNFTRWGSLADPDPETLCGAAGTLHRPPSPIILTKIGVMNEYTSPLSTYPTLRTTGYDATFPANSGIAAGTHVCFRSTFGSEVGRRDPVTTIDAEGNKKTVLQRRAHQGWDFTAAVGDTVYAIADGKVKEIVISNEGFGNYVFFEFTKQTAAGTNPERNYVFYAHLDSVSVALNECVIAGQPVGIVGTTGNARTNAPHLHIGFKANAIPSKGVVGWKDPALFFGDWTNYIP